MNVPDALAMATRLLQTLNDPARAAVQRCSAVTSFDEGLYEGVLRELGGPDLGELVEDGCVEENRGWGGFQVPGRLRDAAWTSWWSEAGLSPATRQVPSPLRELAVRIAEWTDTPPEEELRALVLSDPDNAADLFERVYREYDEVLNYPGCQNLLDVLSRPELLPLLSPRLIELRNDRDRYLKARLYWHSSMVATTRYLARPEVEARLIGLVDSYGSGALRMHATGGMGKSTVVHRFIAWHCVARRIPCALVDLDSETFDATVAVRHPWLVILEFAAQLNLQIDGAPYHELLREYGVYRSMLLPAAGDATRSSSAAAADPSALERYASDVVRRFQLVTAALPMPMLLVVDTLEEATLSYPDAEPFIRMLANLRDAAPQTKLVLAGRGTSCEAEIPSLRLLFPDASQADLVIAPFTDEEAVRYLRGVRGIGDTDLIDAVVGRAAGSPWLLSMYGDVAAYRMVDTAAMVDHDPFLAWCIDRVVARLPGGALQWLTRYGVVPRRLDRDFAERIVYPRMLAGMTGSPDDNPELDKRPPHSKPLFPTRGGLVVPFDAVWDQLARYASESSWAKLSPDRRTVLFDAALSGPMRRMLAVQPVSRVLHKAAVDYYQELGDRREELYHRFQLDPAGWVVHWRQAIEDCWSRRDIDGVVALTEDAVAPDYGGEPDPFGERSGPTVDVPSLMHAYTEQAWALTLMARRLGATAGDPLWTQVGRATSLASRQGMTHPHPRWVAARVSYLLVRAECVDALDVLDEGAAPADGSVDPAVSAELTLLRAQALSGLGRYTDAWAAIVPAIRAFNLVRVFPTTIVRAASIVARLACRQGRVDWAGDLVDEVLQNAEDQALHDLRRLRAQLALVAGTPGQAKDFLDETSDADLLVEALLDGGRPDAGLRAAGSALAGLDADGQAVKRAQLLSLRARCSAALLDHVAMVESLDSAFAIWTSLQDTGAAARTAVTKAGLILDTSGDLRAAQAYLEEFERLQRRPSSAQLARHAIVSARLAVARGSRTSAYATCARALEVLKEQDGDVLLMAEVAVQALAVASPEDAAAVASTLSVLLDQIQPHGARLRLLAGLRRGSGKIGAAERWTGDSLVSEQDPAVLRWNAEIHLAAGDQETAVRLASRAVEGTTDAYSHWLYTEFLSRAGRMNLAPSPLPPPYDWLELRNAYFVLRYENDEPSDEALDRLNSGGMTQWSARAQVARSRMLRLLGRDDEAEAAAYRAREIYGELDDPRENDSELVAYAADVRGELPEWSNIIDVRIMVGIDGDLRISVGHEHVGTAPSDTDLVTVSEPISNSPVAMRRMARTPGGLIRLEVEAGAVAEPLETTVPWPAALHAIYRAPNKSTRDKTEVRLMQLALTMLGLSPGPIDGRFGKRTRRKLIEFQRDNVHPVDGRAGPLTWAALTRVVRELPARRPVVLSVERDIEASIRSARGAIHYGASLAFLFDSQGWVHDSLDLLDLRIPAVDVLYVNGSMESSGQVPVISAQSQTYGYESSWRAASQAESLTVTMFDRFLKEAAVAHGLAPIVVLDVSLPETGSEADRQVRLRNDFAHQLMTMGHAPTILAICSGPDGAQGNLVTLLSAAAKSGWTAVELLVQARMQPIYEAAVALFSAAPIERFPVIAMTRRS